MKRKRKGSELITMLEAFEKCLADNGDLEATARKLEAEVNKQQQESLRVIRHDMTTCKLIREGMSEPPGSAVYAISRAYIRMYRKKHCPGGDRLAHLLMKEATAEDDKTHRKEKDANGNPTEEGEKAGTTGSEKTIV